VIDASDDEDIIKPNVVKKSQLTKKKTETDLIDYLVNDAGDEQQP